MEQFDNPWPERVVQACDRAIQGSCPAGLPLEWVYDVVSPTWAHISELSWWPPAVLPAMIARALGRSDDECLTLTVSCVLDFAAADVIDDIQDHNWLTERACSATEAITIATFLSFLAQKMVVTLATTETQGAIAQAYAAYLFAKIGGQHRDLLQRGPLPPRIGESDYLMTIKGKTGESLAWYSSIAARLWASDTETSALHAYGLALGCGMQLASDCHDLREPSSRDHLNQQWTLPVISAWKRLRAIDRKHLAKRWHAGHPSGQVADLIAQSGAWSYCDARVMVYLKEAEMALNDLTLTAMPVTDLQQYARNLTRAQLSLPAL